MTSNEHFDHLVVGAGRRGLLAALRMRRAGGHFAVLDAATRPGGGDETVRSNGFACELGALAFAPDELEPLLALLERAPTPIELGEAARTGHVHDGTGLVPAEVQPVPVSFRSGNEELWQACRRELGPALRLGRAARQLTRTASGWEVTLGGEVPTVLDANELTLAVPAATAGHLLGTFDPALADVASRVAHEACAFVFLGDHDHVADTIAGYGIARGEGATTPLAEVIHCSRAFPGRAMPGRGLLRAELRDVPDGASDADLVALTLRELANWTGRDLQFGFTKVHRFAVPVQDGASAELQVRLRSLPARVGALRIC